MHRHISAVVTTLAALAVAAAGTAMAPSASALPSLPSGPSVSSAPRAAATPSTSVKFHQRATATRYVGKAFDTCTAPGLDAMNAWLASPYRALGIYVGGQNRSCAQPNLTPDWVGAVSDMGWKLLPIYLGLQAPCSDRASAAKFTPSQAEAQGSASADDAIASMAGLGLQPGSTVYYDLESYTPTITSCRVAVLKFLSGYTKRLHSQGYLSGVYVTLGSGAAHLAGAYTSTSYARPDVLWVARWDGKATTTGFTGVPNTAWHTHQRAKQYLGDHNETYNAAKINVDSDYVDAPVATVVRPHFVTTNTQYRTRPTKSASSGGALFAGTQVQVMCQTPGSKVSGSTVWDKLSTGTYVSDVYLDTPAKPGFSKGIARCYYPYQVKPAAGTAERSGAGSTKSKKGTLYGGALAWVVCQKKASRKTNGTAVWDRLDNGYYVTDHDVSTFSKTTYSSPVPRC